MRFPARSFLLLLVVLLGVLAAAGCRTVQDDQTRRVDPLPWNEPAGWENNVIGVPF